MNSKVFLLMGMVLSFIIASALNIYPLGHALATLRPMFLVLVLIFWVLYRPELMRVWLIFLIGIGMDLLLDTHLGHQAFCAVSVAFALRVVLLYAKELTLSYAWKLATFALVAYQCMLWVLQSFEHGFVWAGMGSMWVSVMIFPMVWYPLYWVNQQYKERAW